MSFQPFTISYTPPATVPAPLRSTTSVAAATTQLSSQLVPQSIPQNTAAAAHIAQLSALAATAAYLESLVEATTAGSGVTFPAEENPSLAQALGNLYPGNTPPGISVEMYSNMLDAALGLDQIQSVLGNDSANEASGQNIADLLMATKTFEQAMIQSLGYQANLTPLLRSLKGDQIILQNMQDHLADYPAYQGTSSTLNSGLDVSPAMSSLLTNYAQNQAGNYAQIFNLLTTVSDVENDLAGVIALLGSSNTELASSSALLSSQKSTVHGNALQALADDMSQFVFVSLISDLSQAANRSDRMASLAITPLKNSISPLGQMLRKMGSASRSAGTITTGGLRGMTAGTPSLSNPSGAPVATSNGNQSAASITAKLSSTLGTVSKGVLSVLSHLDLASRKMSHKNDALQEQLRKALSRRTSDQNSRGEILSSLKNLEATINLVTGLIQAGSAAGGGSNHASSIQSISQVIANFNSPSGASFSIQNNAVVVTPASVPPVTPAVQQVLNQGGAGLVTTSSLATSLLD